VDKIGSPTRKLRIGLTGGIASGKSAVADFFAGLGIAVVDTDLIAREVVQPGQPGLTAVTAEFGTRVLQADGSLDRGRLRQIIFADPAARELLNSILHPLIRSRAAELADQAEGPYVVIAVPLLAETGFTNLVDRILVVDCTLEEQRQRLMSRDGESYASASRIIETQATREQRLAIADDVINNSGSLEQLAQAVDDLHQRYLRLNAPNTAKP
jgi:dephospho-CoA kinase